MKSAKDKALAKLDFDTVTGMESMDEQSLKQTIYEASNAMKQVRDELDANEKYQALLEGKKDMEAGKREVDARQKAKIAYALELMEAFGQKA